VSNGRRRGETIDRVSRVVVLPDWQGCGAAFRLLETVGTAYTTLDRHDQRGGGDQQAEARGAEAQGDAQENVVSHGVFLPADLRLFSMVPGLSNPRREGDLLVVPPPPARRGPTAWSASAGGKRRIAGVASTASCGAALRDGPALRHA